MSVHTVDYIVSIAIVSMLLTTSVMITSHQLSTAWEFQQDQLTTIATVDLLNNLLQNPGYPFDWGQTSVIPTHFGLKSSSYELTVPSSFTPLRLMQTSQTISYAGEQYRNLTGLEYSLFLPTADYLDYAAAYTLLNVDPAYGFQIRYKPLLDVSIRQITINPLAFGVTVAGISNPVSDADLNATLYYISKTAPYPTLPTPLTAHAVSNISGTAELSFLNINAANTLYVLFIRVNLGGVTSYGYHTNANPQAPLLPIVTNYSEGQVSLIHRQDVIAGYSYGNEVYYNATYLIQVGNTEFRAVNINSAEGVVSVNDSVTLNLQVGLPGILLITTRTTTGDYGLLLMPWGINSLGLSVNYGVDPINPKTVVTRAQHAAINGVSYLIELSCWRRIEG